VTDVPEVVQAWVRQLLDPQFLSLIDAIDVDQIDVRLSASKGKIRKSPVIILNGGPQAMVDG